MAQQDEWTCGKGLAANAVLPERLGAVLATMAEVLQVHMEALDPQDEASRPELDAYRSVTQHLGQIASHLAVLAQEMAGYQDVPMGRHDLEVMNRPLVGESFAALVGRKQDLHTLLQEMEEEDREMLDQMPD